MNDPTCTGSAEGKECGAVDVEAETFLRSFGELHRNSIELSFLKPYFASPAESCLYVNPVTGVVSSELQMTAQEILDYWSQKVFTSPSPDDYSGRFPYAAARHLYVWRTLMQFLEYHGRADQPVRFVDFASGEGDFLALVQKEMPSWTLLATEGAPHLAAKGRHLGYTVYVGGLGLNELPDFQGQVGSCLWTLSCAGNPAAVVQDVWSHLAEDGFLVVAESSRILVPFRKSLRDLISQDNPADCHPYYFSARSLCALLRASGFEIRFVNRFFDSDVLLVIAQKSVTPIETTVEVDAAAEVVGFFEEWHRLTPLFESWHAGR